MMPWPETIALLALLAAGAFWFDSFQAREAAMRAARTACRSDDLLLLDDTVALASLRTGRDEAGRLRLRRVYRFEYSDTGDNRREGHLILLGDQLSMVHVSHPSPVERLDFASNRCRPLRREDGGGLSDPASPHEH